MSDLSDLVPALKRELAAPGEFVTTYPLADDADLSSRLADAFALAQLDGYFPDQALNIDDLAVAPDLSAAGGALIVLYAGMQVIRAQIRGLNSNFRAKAGPAEIEIAKPVNLLRDELKYLTARRDDLVIQARRSGRAVYVLDGYLARLDAGFNGLGFYAYELQG